MPRQAALYNTKPMNNNTPQNFEDPAYITMRAKIRPQQKGMSKRELEDLVKHFRRIKPVYQAGDDSEMHSAMLREWEQECTAAGICYKTFKKLIKTY